MNGFIRYKRRGRKRLVNWRNKLSKRDMNLNLRLTMLAGALRRARSGQELLPSFGSSRMDGGRGLWTTEVCLSFKRSNESLIKLLSRWARQQASSSTIVRLSFNCSKKNSFGLWRVNTTSTHSHLLLIPEQRLPITKPLRSTKWWSKDPNRVWC